MVVVLARQEAFGRSGPRRKRLWLHWPVALAAVISLAAGWDALWRHYRGGEPSSFRAPAGVVLSAVGLCQLWIAWRLWRRAALLPAAGPARSACAPHARTSPRVSPAFWRRLFLGLVVSYLVGLALGPDPDVGYFFQASLAFWYTVALWLLVSAPAGLAWRPPPRPPLAQPQRPAASRLGLWRKAAVRSAAVAALGAEQLAFLLAAVFVAAEAALRVTDLVTDTRQTAAYVAQALKLPPGSKFRGRQVNELGYWDDPFQPVARPGTFRIAALGQGPTLWGTAETNCLVQLERRVPGIEVYNFGIPQAGPREYAAQLVAEVAGFHPDLVLTFFSVGGDIVHQVPLPGAFDWRGLRVVQWSAGSPSSLPGLPRVAWDPGGEAREYEAYLRSEARRLAVCRSPIDKVLERRWQETFAYLDDLVRQCRRREMRVVLVLVPETFQTSPLVCEALRRRAGYEPGQLDLELPQRRLALFADEHEVPVIDLLPYFRACESPPFGRNDHAWSQRGHELAVEVIGGWLQTRYGGLIAAHAQAPAE